MSDSEVYDDQRWFTPTEAAFYVRVDPGTIHRWVREGHLRAYELPTGGGRRFKRADLDGLLDPPRPLKARDVPEANTWVLEDADVR